MIKRVLVVDDSNYIRSYLKDIISKIPGMQVVDIAETGEKALDLALEKNPDIITLDNILPDMTGIDVLKVLKKQLPKTRIIMISAVGQQSTIDEAFSNGASHYFVKPVDSKELNEALKEA